VPSILNERNSLTEICESIRTFFKVLLIIPRDPVSSLWINCGAGAGSIHKSNMNIPIL
jgi:hypothetical protein